MPLPQFDFEFDWKTPNYRAVLNHRLQAYARLRANPTRNARMLLNYYKTHPAQMIIDWGMTYDPRNAGTKIPTWMPFLLFPKQEEMSTWIYDLWKAEENGIGEKTRDMGMSWICVATLCCLALTNKGFVGGLGSRVAELVDQTNDPGSLFWKARMFMRGLPVELRGGYDERKHAPQFRLTIPDMGSMLKGGVGNEIGRGDRTSIYVIDESAYLENPFVVDAALSQTTRCRIDISTPNGMANSFAQRRFAGAVKVFSYHWRDDPRKDQQWYDNEVIKYNNPLLVARELDINYADSIEGMVIPTEWFQAAIDSHVKLGFDPTGQWTAGFDVADEGQDKNALAVRHGIYLDSVDEWSGVNSDIYRSTERVFGLLDQRKVGRFIYDADGLGAGVKGDARRINEDRAKAGKNMFMVTMFRGSASVWNPDMCMVHERKNKDFFANLKAQSWWALRIRFEETYKAVVKGLKYNPDDLISINGKMKNLTALQMQLQQPTYQTNGVGKIVIDKTPDGMKSPNLADAVMIAFNPATRAMEVWERLSSKHRAS